MEILFENDKSQKLFSSKTALRKKFGEAHAVVIQRRMKQLLALSRLSDLFTLKHLRPHELSGRRKGQFSINTKDQFRLLFSPGHNPVPAKEDGGMDWTKITKIVILEIGDTHEHQNR